MVCDRRSFQPGSESTRVRRRARSLTSKTLASVDDGPQRVTGLGAQASDAIEKPVDVHPDGEERIATSSALFNGRGVTRRSLRPLGSPRTTLKIYPSLMAHVVESVEGIMERPYGCGEQTISSTYPSLLLLKYASDGLGPALEARATTYLQEGYERLKSYRAADGGIGYWSDSASDTALTAYALRFLLDADGVIDVDDSFVEGLRDRLLASQHRRPMGSRSTVFYRRLHADAMDTAYVAASLARLQCASKHTSTGVSARAPRLGFAVTVARGH